MTDFIVAIIIIALFGLSLAYIIREKKNGVKCIGCPSAKTCKKRTNSASKCNCNNHF